MVDAAVEGVGQEEGRVQSAPGGHRVGAQQHVGRVPAYEGQGDEEPEEGQGGGVVRPGAGGKVARGGGGEGGWVGAG